MGFLTILKYNATHYMASDKFTLEENEKSNHVPITSSKPTDEQKEKISKGYFIIIIKTGANYEIAYSNRLGKYRQKTISNPNLICALNEYKNLPQTVRNSTQFPDTEFDINILLENLGSKYKIRQVPPVQYAVPRYIARGIFYVLSYLFAVSIKSLIDYTTRKLLPTKQIEGAKLKIKNDTFPIEKLSSHIEASYTKSCSSSSSSKDMYNLLKGLETKEDKDEAKKALIRFVDTDAFNGKKFFCEVVNFCNTIEDKHEDPQPRV